MGDLLSFKLGARKGCVRATSAIDWYERGLVLEAADIDDIDGAMSAYRRALVGRPDLADAYNNLGRLHHDREQLGDAEALYRLALCSDAGVALYWFNLGVVLEDQGRIAEAIGAYERALALDAQLADAHFNLARQLELVSRRGPTASGQGVVMIDELVLRRAVRHLKRYRDLVRAG